MALPARLIPPSLSLLGSSLAPRSTHRSSSRWKAYPCPVVSSCKLARSVLQLRPSSIARTLAANPEALPDEPSRGIQPNVAEDIERTIMRLDQEAGMTVLLVEQNVALVRRAGHRFAMMEKGRVVAGGAINELTDDLVHRHMAV